MQRACKLIDEGEITMEHPISTEEMTSQAKTLAAAILDFAAKECMEHNYSAQVLLAALTFYLHLYRESLREIIGEDNLAKLDNSIQIVDWGKAKEC